MANQPGAAAPPIQRLVEAETICFSEEAAPAGNFAVSVACLGTRSFEFRRRGHERPRPGDVFGPEKHAAGTTTMTFDVADVAALRSTDACRGALRGMLAALPQLQWLHLAEDEWDAVVPGDLVPEIVRVASRGDGFTFSFMMKVHRRVIHDERSLVMACKASLASTAPGEKKDCPICLNGLELESAVDLPGCERHPFHRRCISEWFSTRASTCPICRGNVWLAALPTFSELFSTGEPAQATT